MIAFLVRDFNSLSDKPRVLITLYSPAIDALKNGGSSELTVILTPLSNNVLIIKEKIAFPDQKSIYSIFSPK